MKRVSKDLLSVTLSEQLWLDRKRRGETQAGAARRLGLTVRLLRNAERGARVKRASRAAAPGGRLWPPTIAEMCRLARRRSGSKLTDVAKRAHLSHVSVLEFERRGDPRLVAWWRSRGFTFGQMPDKLREP